MNVHIDANAVVEWEKGKFDLPACIADRHPTDTLKFSAAAWQELAYGAFAWEPARAQKRLRFLNQLRLPVCPYGRRQAQRAARIAADLKSTPIGFADCQVAASAIEDNATLLSFNREHFSRAPGLRLAKV